MNYIGQTLWGVLSNRAFNSTTQGLESPEANIKRKRGMISHDSIRYETRRPVLMHTAKQLGVEVHQTDTIAFIKESIMAAIKSVPAKPAAVPAKPAPAKPMVAAAPPKPMAPKPAAPAPAKPAPAPAKPGVVAAHKPGLNGAANGVSAAAKPAPAAKPAAAAPAPSGGGGASKADLETLRKEFAALSETVTQALEALNQRVQSLELIASGYGNFVSVDAEGNIVLDLDKADEETLRDWAYQFGVSNHNADGETIRKDMKKLKAAKGWNGWEAKNELPRPQEEAAEPAAEGEEEITEDAINKMNATELAELADRCGLDRTDKPSPKVLRARILTLLSGGEEAAPEATEEAAADEPGLEQGTILNVTYEGEVHQGLFVGYGEGENDGMFIIDVEGLGGQVAVPGDIVSMPE